MSEHESAPPPRHNDRGGANSFTLDSRTIVIALVALLGGGNLWFTKSTGDQTLQESAGTTRQIAEMHRTLTEFKDRITEIDKRWERVEGTADAILESVLSLERRAANSRAPRSRSEQQPQMPTHTPPYPVPEEP
jgi:hypothetical protein